MALWSRIVKWVDDDLATSPTGSGTAGLPVGLLPLIAIGLPASALPNPWKLLLLCLGAALSVAWMFFWFWRWFLHFRSGDSLLSNWQASKVTSSGYQYAKVRGLAKLAMIVLVAAFIAIVYFYFRNSIEEVFGSRLTGYAFGIAGSSILIGVVGVLFLLTSPKQDEQITKWLSPGFSAKASQGIRDRRSRPWPDPSQPDYETPTILFLMRMFESDGPNPR
jgi:hypothetical protein